MDTDTDQLSDIEQTSDIDLLISEATIASNKFAKRDNYLSVVPWRNPEQFLEVYKCLYSKSITDKRWAVDQISVWETRCYPALPTAIEATVVIVRTIIQDMLFQVEKTFCQEKDIQMLYSMSLVRFINLIVERDQKAQGKINISVLAHKRNIPSWIVDLRHEATHAFCPSLPVLRMGTESALQYLENTFWKVEVANIKPIVKSLNSVEKTIENSIDRFRLVQFRRVDKIGSHAELIRDFRGIMKEITVCIQVHKRKFVDCFVKPGVFINAEDIVRLLRLTGVVFLEEDEEMCLPRDLEYFWLPVIRRIHAVNLIPYFLEVLLISQEHVINRISQKTAVAWVMHIFLATTPHDSFSRLSKVLKLKGVHLNLHHLLYGAMKGTNRFTLHIFNLLVNRLGHKKRYSDLFCMMALYQGMFVQNDDPCQTAKQKMDVHEMVFTLEDAEEDLEEMKCKKRRFKAENVWSLAQDSMDFSSLPLGAVVNPAVGDGESTDKDDSRMDVIEEDTRQQKFILPNESDNEDLTVEVRVDSNRGSGAAALPATVDMIYRW